MFKPQAYRTTRATAISQCAISPILGLYRLWEDHLTIALIALFTLGIFTARVASAASVDDLTYTISNGEVTITDCSTAASGSLIIPATIETYPVTTVGNSAFSFCYSLTDVTIPSSVTSIQSNAFYSCYSLTSVTIPSSITSIPSAAFNSCYSLTSITIPVTVTSIGSYSFQGCSSLTNVTIPSSVSFIGDSAFNSCYSLTSVTIPSSVSTINTQAFRYCRSLTSVTIPNSVTSIGTYSFQSCYSLKNVTIPSTVTSIGTSAFQYCYGMTSAIFEGNAPSLGNGVFSLAATNAKAYVPTSSIATYGGDGAIFGGLIVSDVSTYQPPTGVVSLSVLSWTVSNGEAKITDCDPSASGSLTIPTTLGGWPVTSIGFRAFEACLSLTSVTIPSTITSIEGYAFKGCFSMTSVTIPSSVSTIGSNAFQDCFSLTGVVLPSSITSIENSTFSSCNSLTSVNVPDSVTTIGGSAFESCYSLTNLDIPNSVTSIGMYAFGSCYSLTNVNIPDSITSIANGAYGYCYSLTSVVIPSGVTSIGNSAFSYCASLSSVTIPNLVTTIESSAFYKCYNLSLIIFEGPAPASVGSIVFTNVTSGAEALVTSTHAASFGGIGVIWNSLIVTLANEFTLSIDTLANGSINGAGTYIEGTSISITATPGNGYAFVEWSGSASGSSNPLTVVMDSDKLIGATFQQISTFSNTISNEAPTLIGNEALPNAIPFNDGVSNLLKYAFNLNLAGPDLHYMVQDGSSGLPGGRLVDASGETCWRIQYVRRRFSNLTYTPQKSSDLSNGSFIPLTGTELVEIIDANWERVTIDESFDPTSNPRLFSRLAIEENP